MTPRVVVTGLGVVAPNGIGVRSFWEASLRGDNAVGPITRFDASSYACNAAGEVREFEAGKWVSAKIARQTDRSVHMGIAACRMAADDAGLDVAVSPSDIGISFANTLGGMGFAEPELYEQTFRGPDRVSAFQSIAWFYAAAQGQWSISTGIQGYGKSIVGDRAGGHQALALGAIAIRSGRCRAVFAGGFEAPLVPYAYLIHETSGLLARTDGRTASCAYRPFDSGRTGAVLGEGSGIVVIEELTQARARGARIYAELTGFEMNCGDDARTLAACCSGALDRASMDAADVDHVLAEGLGTREDDAIEAEAIRTLFGGSDRTSVSVPKSMTGHMLAAAGAVDAITAVLMINGNVVVPTLHADSGEDLGRVRHITRAAVMKIVDSVVSLARGRGGINTAMVIQRFADGH